MATWSFILSLPIIYSWSHGTMSPINAHHTGNAIKGEEMAISQANISDSKASTDINLAECLEIDGVHAESFEVTKKPSEENWRRSKSLRLLTCCV